jgi:membrane-bound serine protease (ClpP class)
MDRYRSIRLTATGVALVALSVSLASGWVDAAPAELPEGERGTVFVASVDGTIDLGLAPFLSRTLKKAADDGAAAVVLELNTFGGRLDAAVLIRDELLKSPVRSIAFVNKRAISAGALIALGATDIVMAPGGTIGAATPVTLDQGGRSARPVDEKTVSYVRKEFRATAESRGRSPKLAEAMVDPDVDLSGLAPKGKLLTLTSHEALKHGLANAHASDLGAALQAVGLGGVAVERIQLNWAERVARALTHPVVSSLLMTIAVFGILIELRTPGFGLPGVVGLLCLVAFFWGHWLVKLAGWEEVLLIGGGVVLLALEIFALPGFGAAGVFGILGILAGLTMSLIGGGASASAIATAATRVGFSLAIAVGAALVLFRFLPKLPFAGRLVLGASLPAGGGDGDHSSTAAEPGYRHGVGRTLTPLRPAGTAEISGERIDVVSDGDFVEAGEAIEVVRRDGNRTVVRRPQVSATRGGET